MRGNPDIISIVEAAYRVDGSAQEWGGRVLHAADRALGGLPGGFTCEVRINRDRTLAIDRGSAAILRQSPETIGAIFDGLTQTHPGALALRLPENGTAARCVLTSEVDPESKLSYRRRLSQEAVNDGINIFCLDLDRTGFLLSLGITDRRMLTSAARRNLRRVATHMLAALRLRKRLRSADADAAILSPGGRLLHATGEATLADARRALEAAVVKIERARTSLRPDADEALGAWRGLVSARWTLVDQIDAHGARYVVARENPPSTARLPTLTLAERCVVTYAARGFSTKEIAYSLGLADATVRVLIMRAVRRSGLRNRDELLALTRAAAIESD